MTDETKADAMSSRIVLVATPAVADALAKAAAAESQSKGSYIRSALVARLREDGRLK